MSKRWFIRPHDDGAAGVLAKNAGISLFLAHLFLARGISSGNDVREFLNPSLAQLNRPERLPERLPGCNDVAEKLWGAIQTGKRITVYGDYDADGMTAIAIIYRAIKLLRGNVDYYVPSRLDEGYGLNSDAVKKIHSNGSNVIVTVDCGINSCNEAEVARQLGIELLITDHHNPGIELPNADAIAHPQLVRIDGDWTTPHSLTAEQLAALLPDNRYPFVGISGAFVAFKVAWRLCQLASGNAKVLDKFRQFLRLGTGLATIGTIADVVPLLDENRVLVHFGLKDALINSPPTGIVAIVKQVAMNKKTAKKVLASEDIAFTIAPMLNASGRLNKAELGIEILITENESRADELAGELYRLNEQRQSIERSMTTEATKMVEEQNQAGAAAFVIAKDASDHSWHQGVIGIVAGRIKDRFNRPCVIIARDWTGTNSATGSARSIDEVDMYKALESCSQHLERFGGHPLAAGLRVANDKIDSFRNALCDYVGRTVPKEKLIAELPIDDELPFAAINRELATQIEKMAPFGACNNRPVFCSTSVTQKTKPRYIGDKRGIALQLIQDGVERRAVTFDVHWFADLEECYNKNKKIDVAFLPSVSSYNGETELKLRDWRVADE